MPIDPGFQLARGRHRRTIEQPHDPRSSPKLARTSSSTNSRRQLLDPIRLRQQQLSASSNAVGRRELAD
jgi:hypothetical protein